MAEERLRIPASVGGLVRYFEDYKSKIEIQPSYVVFAIVVVILLEVGLRIFFR